jgi:DNA repair exonuclease SbcCD nuclease subunit
VEHVAVRHLGETLAHLYGISYPTSEVRENLVPKFPKEIEKPFAIGILHGNVGGDPNHDNYAPCSLHDLLTSRMDYWALGHIHSRKILREHSPSVVYPGTTQGRSGREPGARGCIVVRVARGGHLSLEFNSTDVVRWFTQAVDIRDLRTIDDLLEELAKQKDAIRREAEGRAAIWRLPLTGRGELHGLLRRLDLERDLSQPLREGEPGRSDFVWLESIQDMTRPSVDLVQRRQVQDFIGDVLRAAETLRGEEHPQGVLQHAVDRHIGHRLLAAKLEKLAPSDWLAFLDEAENYAVDLLTGDED